MLFRYDIGEKLDLSRFTKQATHSINTIPDNLFEFHMHDFVVEVRVYQDTIPCINSKGFLYVTARRVTVKIFDVKRIDSCITQKKEVYVMNDDRFSLFPEIRAMFYKDIQAASVVPMEDVPKIAESVCTLLTGIHKLGKLKAFL